MSTTKKHKINTDKLTVAVLIPCWNEEQSIKKTINACLLQTRKADQIVVVDDCSTDKTPEILKSFGNKIKVVRPDVRTGNKSGAQEYGMKFVTTDIVITTDGDTLMHPDFIAEISKEFHDPKVGAAAGYVKSLKYNWLTRCRAFEYSTSQNIHKLAQSYMNYMYVIPGAAGAFLTKVFRDHLKFDHDTLTEDLDFTYKLHKAGKRVAYNRKAIVYTQDPMTLHAYMNQMRRWLGGGWQNLMKHKTMEMKPAQALEISLIYIEGVVFSMLLFIVPLVSLKYMMYMLGYYFLVAFVFSTYAAFKERRADLVLAPIPYMFLMYVNSYIFLEQMVKEVILREKNMTWFKPERANL